MTTTEEWRRVPGFPDYDVSSHGRVKSHRQALPRILRDGPTSTGYRGVMPYDADGQRRMRKVHVLVAAAFLGPRPAGMEVRHLDGNKLNNAVSNLSYGSRSRNALDAVEHGTHSSARKTHCPASHAYDEANTYVDRQGRRHCRICTRANSHARRTAAAFAAANLSTERAA